MISANRINCFKVAPEGIQILCRLESYVDGCGLEPNLTALVNLRVSQLNGCAYCIEMYTQKALRHGESRQRIDGLSTWWEKTFYNQREQGAFAWATTITKISRSHVPYEAFEQTSNLFTEKELVDLTLAIIAVNAWNQLIVSFRLAWDMEKFHI